MAQRKHDDPITVLDIGTSKISAMIVRAPDGGDLQVLGTGQRESKGVSRGYIADLKLAETSIRGAVEQAERIAGLSVESAWVGFSAGGLVSRIIAIEADLGAHRIEQAHIDELLRAGLDAIDTDGLHLLHAHPTLYTLDGLEGVRNPLGLHAGRLGIDIHAVLSERSPVLNLEYCVGSAYLGVEGTVAAPVATGLACLSDEERDLGVALVELGAGVTNVSLFACGMLVGLTSIAQGAADITDAIAGQFGMRRSQAERLKCFHGSAMTSPRDNHDMVEVAPVAGETVGDPIRITRAQLIAVIRERMEDLTGRIAAALDEMGFTARLGRQVVLTGGGAELKGVADYAQGVLGRSVRVGQPFGFAGLPEAHAGPAFATLAGLARFAVSAPADLKALASREQLVHRAAAGVLGRLRTAMRNGY